MKNKYIFLLNNLFLFIWTIQSLDDKKSPDLVTSYESAEGFSIQLEAFNEKNDVTSKNQKWYSIGYPRLLETKSSKSDSSNLFHFTKESFYTHIEMLTVQQKKLLAEEASKKYNSKIDAKQIENMILSKFECHLETDDGENQIHGRVLDFRKYPLRMHFDAKSGSEKRTLFEERYLSIKENPLSLECLLISDRLSFSTKIMLETDRHISKLIPIYVPPGTLVSISSNLVQLTFNQPG